MNTVKGSTKKGFRVTHSNRSNGKSANLTNHMTNINAPTGGMGKGAENVRGSAGNGQKSGTP
jgi:hypothetical protein